MSLAEYALRRLIHRSRRMLRFGIKKRQKLCQNGGYVFNRAAESHLQYFRSTWKCPDRKTARARARAEMKRPILQFAQTWLFCNVISSERNVKGQKGKCNFQTVKATPGYPYFGKALQYCNDVNNVQYTTDKAFNQENVHMYQYMYISHVNQVTSDT